MYYVSNKIELKWGTEKMAHTPQVKTSIHLNSIYFFTLYYYSTQSTLLMCKEHLGPLQVNSGWNVFKSNGFDYSMIDWLIFYCFTSRSRIFHLYGDVTIAGEGMQNLGLCSALRAFEQEGNMNKSRIFLTGTTVNH
jgi:hypothetical protein